MSYCRVVMMGNLTRDPEMRHLPDGKACTTFSVALNRKWKTESGEERSDVSYIDVTAFGNRAENVAKYFRKGDAILVEGRLKQDRWEDKTTGAARTRIQVLLDQFAFCGGKRKEDAGDHEPATERPAPSARPRTTATQGRSRAPEPADEPPAPEDDEVPF